MYADYYGFSEMPFRLTPDSRFFFASGEHSRALSHLIFGLAHQEGFIIITGEVGAGKTMLLERLQERLDRGSYLISRVDTAQVLADDLLRLVASGFGVAPGPDKATLLRGIAEVLRDGRAAGRRCLLVVDEVQALELPALEELRMLSNLSEAGRSLVQTILLGQPQFRRTLARAELDQLRQRVLASYHLGPLREEEMQAYVEHRLRAVGWNGRPRWEDGTFDLLHQCTGGIPRRINRLCGRLLLHGAFEQSDSISPAMVRLIARELERDLAATADSATTNPDKVPDLIDRVEALEVIVARRERVFARLSDLLTNGGSGR